jgi:hypothetical protein
MSYHSTIEDYNCGNCGKGFLPFKASMNCPNCDDRATKESGIIEDTLEALKWHEHDHPGGYGVFSLADSYILFASEVSGNVEPDDDPVRIARRFTVRVEEGDAHLKLHLSRFLEEILPTVIEKKFT